MLCRQDMPSATNETVRTIHATRAPWMGWRSPSSCTAMAIERQPPIRNDAMAAINAQRKRSRPCPIGCTSSGGMRSRRRETASSTSLIESAPECAASASIAVDPDTIPAMSFATAMNTLASRAMTTVRVLSPCAALRRAVAERRCGGVCTQIDLHHPVVARGLRAKPSQALLIEIPAVK